MAQKTHRLKNKYKNLYAQHVNNYQNQNDVNTPRSQNLKCQEQWEQDKKHKKHVNTQDVTNNFTKTPDNKTRIPTSGKSKHSRHI